jgi:hypothetical protein
VRLEVDAVQDPADLGGGDRQPGDPQVAGQQPVGPRRVRARRGLGRGGDDPQLVLRRQAGTAEWPGRSVGAARRSAAKRLRQARTVSTCRPAARATAAFDIPSATARITLARCTCPNGAVRESATCSSPRRSASVNSITNGLVSVIVPLGDQPIDPLIIPQPPSGVATG